MLVVSRLVEVSIRYLHTSHDDQNWGRDKQKEEEKDIKENKAWFDRQRLVY